jgi:hypothetical protein
VASRLLLCSPTARISNTFSVILIVVVSAPDAAERTVVAPPSMGMLWDVSRAVINLGCDVETMRYSQNDCTLRRLYRSTPSVDKQYVYVANTANSTREACNASQSSARSS